MFVFVSQKTKRPRFNSFEKKTEIQLNTKYIYIYIYICIYVCMYVCVRVLGPKAHYLCIYWVWDPIRGRKIVRGGINIIKGVCVSK